LKNDIDYFRLPLELVRKYCNKDMSILDFRCSTENLVKILEELGYKNIICVDIDMNLILEGRKENQ